MPFFVSRLILIWNTSFATEIQDRQSFDDGAHELRKAPLCSETLSTKECQCAEDSECGGVEWGPDFLKDGYCFLAYIQVQIYI